jgi:membrane protease YdiL (CAAX protease family)
LEQRKVSAWPADAATWTWFVLGLAVLFVLFDVTATWLGSDRGQYGLAVCAIVLGATVVVMRALPGIPPTGGLSHRLGLGRPRAAGLLAAVTVVTLLLLVVPAYLAVSGAAWTMDAGWGRLVPGLFAQAGVAEEVLFRAYLYGQLRPGRTYWRAALLSSGPFVLVHLELLFRMPAAVAVASILLSAVISLPLARLFDLGGRTIWAPAILHAVVQGVVKVIDVEEPTVTFPLVWMAASAAIPFLVFAWRFRNSPEFDS